MEVSVILPVYNAEEYITEAIDSILRQTFSQYEICIIDDGSTDNSRQIIEQYCKNNNRIKFVSRENRGLPVTLNELIEMSSGKYLARMDADDKSLPTRLEKQFDFMEKNNNVAVVGCKSKVMGTEKYLFNTIYENSSVRAIRMMFGNNGVAHPSAMIRKAYLERNGLEYREDAMGAEDYWLWSDIAKSGGEIVSLDEPLLEYRMHPNQISSLMTDTQKEMNASIQLDQMQRYGDFDRHDLNILMDCYNYTFEYKVEDYIRVVQKLSSGNRAKGIYNEGLFDRELFNLLFSRGISLYRGGEKSVFKSCFIKDNMSIGNICYCIKEIIRTARTQKDYYKG